jgi:hypothetical protein
VVVVEVEPGLSHGDDERIVRALLHRAPVLLRHPGALVRMDADRLWGLSAEEVGDITTENAKRFFRFE